MQQHPHIKTHDTLQPLTTELWSIPQSRGLYHRVVVYTTESWSMPTAMHAHSYHAEVTLQKQTTTIS